MIIYVDVKSGKVDLTRAELEKLLKEKYDEGYKDGKKFCGSVTYTTCPYSYWNCPYRWTNQPSITWTSSNSSTEGTITCTSATSSDYTIQGSEFTSTIPNTITTHGSTTGNITFKEK